MMQRDFTLKTYRLLLEKLKNSKYSFIPFDEYLNNRLSLVTPHKSLCILRHDVDRLPVNSLATAKIEKELGIKGTYYFRSVPESFDESIIKQIAEMGHEIGYHYEEIDFAWRQVNGKWSMFNGKYKKKSDEVSRKFAVGSRQRKGHSSLPSTYNLQPTTPNPLPATKNQLAIIIDFAYEMFKQNLEKMRSVVPVSTICMHGSPLSKYDNKEVWQKYDYKELGIIGEPYFDIDWNEFGYLTDTGRRWNGSDVSVRDKVRSAANEQLTMYNVQCRTTFDVVKAIEENKLPDNIMINVHPERWNDSLVPWVKQLVMQNVKNVVKRFIVEE